MRTPTLLFTAFLAATASAQSPTDTVFFQTTLGSFKLINGEGKVEFTFTGTVLLNKIKGTANVTGNVRKEWDKDGRQAWFGTGKVVVDGSFRAIQWFGRNMKGQWTGKGLARFVGEFDRNLQTGEYWFASAPDKNAWGTFRETPLPPNIFKKPTPIDRDSVKKKTGGG